VIAVDDPYLRLALAQATEESGIECLIAEDGMQALEMIRERRPGAAVLDVALSDVDAFALLSRIRAERLPVRAMLLAAESNCDEMVEGFKMGAHDCMLQPINPREFAVRVEQLLNARAKS
jgi:DNA-binding response OmpR family regulator